MTPEQTKKSANRLLSFLIIVGIIAVSAGLIFVINSTEPTAQKEDAVKKTAMLVDVEPLNQGDYLPKIEGLGTVQGAQDMVLSPRVSGQVVAMSESFIPGNLVKKGDLLLKIDAADYEIRLRQMESALEQAKAAFEIESGRHEVAKQEYALLNRELTGKNKALVLREPQIMTAQASVAAAQAAFDQAKLELERTSVEAPFDAQIITRNVNLGSQINTGTQLARLVGIDEYWVIVTVPISQIQHITFPRDGVQGARVTIKNRKAWPADAVRDGRIVRLIGALDQATRLARILVAVKDPLALKNTDRQPILVNSIVQTEIEGKLLQGVFRIKRDHLHEGDTVWLNRDQKLHISKATVLMKDKQYAYISEGIRENDLLVTSSLATVAEGRALRTDTNN